MASAAAAGPRWWIGGRRRISGTAPGRRVRAWGALLLLGATIAALPGSHSAWLDARAAEPAARGALGPLPRGQVVRRALLADTSQHYLLYVPGRGGQEAPLLVATHGISRNVEEHAGLFAPHAEKHGVVLVAPLFPKDEFEDYQRLGREGRGRRADAALEAIVREVAALTGADVAKILLFGFSGGAQFAHRYTMAHPERVAAAVVAAAGWYTFPDTATPYPYGLEAGEEPANVRFEPERFLRVPIAVFVGAADTGSKNVRRNAVVDRQQGVTRLERALRWTAAMRRAAVSRGLKPLVTCDLVPGVGHSFSQFMQEGGGGERVFAALFDGQHAAPVGGRP